MAIFSILGRVGLDARGFTQGLASVRTSATSTASHITSQLGGSLRSAALGIVGVAGVGSVVAKYKEVINEAAKIRNQAFEFGLSTDEFQALSYTAEQSGRSFEDFRSVMEKLTDAQRKLLLGNVEVGAAFEQLGISAEEFIKIDKPIDQLLTFARAVEASESGAASMAAQLLILGGNAQKLGAVLRNDFSGTFEAFKKFTIPEETIAELSVVADKMTDLDYTFKKFWANQGGWVTGAASFLVSGADALIQATKAGAAKGLFSPMAGQGVEAFTDSMKESIAEYRNRFGRPSQTAQGILDRLDKNTGGQAIKDSVLAEALLALKQQKGGAGGGFDFLKPTGADAFRKSGFFLSGQQQINFNPPIMREQLNELVKVKTEIEALKQLVNRKL